MSPSTLISLSEIRVNFSHLNVRLLCLSFFRGGLDHPLVNAPSPVGLGAASCYRATLLIILSHALLRVDNTVYQSRTDWTSLARMTTYLDVCDSLILQAMYI